MASQPEFEKQGAAGVKAFISMLVQPVIHPDSLKKYIFKKESVTICEVNTCVKNTHGKIKLFAFQKPLFGLFYFFKLEEAFAEL